MERAEPQVTQPDLPQVGIDITPVEIAEPHINLKLRFRPSQVPKQEDGSIDLDREMERRKIAGVYEVNASNPLELTSFSREYLRLLNDEANRYHFTAIPESIQDMKDLLSKPSNHGLSIYNVLGETVAFTTIEDAEKDQGDNWLTKMVMVNNLQNKKNNRENRPQHIGRQVIGKVEDWVFLNKTHDGRVRQNLYAAIVLFVPNAERMYKALRRSGFKTRGGDKDDQATVTMPNGQRELKATRVLGIERDEWENRRYRELHEGEHELDLDTEFELGVN